MMKVSSQFGSQNHPCDIESSSQMSSTSSSPSSLYGGSRRKTPYGGFSVEQVALASLLISILLAFLSGVLLYFYSTSTTVLFSDYTLCKQLNSNITCQSLIDKQMSFDKPVENPCRCRIEFELREDYRATQINVYYGLKNFNQNYRFLAHSNKLPYPTGVRRSAITSYSTPAVNLNDTKIQELALLNVMFDDEFKLTYESNQTIDMDRYNIPMDKSRMYQFKNPSDIELLKTYQKPPRWYREIWALDELDSENTGLENGPLIVWMTLSTFSDFMKLYSIIKPDHNTMRKGQYSLDIDYRFGIYEANRGAKMISFEVVGQQGVRNVRLLISLCALAIAYLLMFSAVYLLVWKQWVFLALVPSLEL